MKLPLYIHIPFCRRKCGYCDFYSLEYTRSLAAEYIDLLVGQIKKIRKQGFSFLTIYLGGGTPSVLDCNLLERLLKSLNCSKVKEVSLEANPESLTEEKLKLLVSLGVNRLSIGVQSFYDPCLKFLGRVHSSQKAFKAVELARKSGFNNISIDLIYGVPGKSVELWRKELFQASELAVDHVSLYSLTYERGTPLSLRLKNKEFNSVSSQEEAEMYQYAQSFLAKKGFRQYEVSNFAKPGFACRHNLLYWADSSYLGLGPSAVSYLDGVRKKYRPCVYTYIEKIRQDKENDLFIEKDELTGFKKAKQTAILNIRTAKGINFRSFKRLTGFNFLKLEEKNIDSLLKEGMLVFKSKKGSPYGLKLTKRGFLFADYVSRQFL